MQKEQRNTLIILVIYYAAVQSECPFIPHFRARSAAASDNPWGNAELNPTGPIIFSAMVFWPFS
jgi:hypothetical protein